MGNTNGGGSGSFRQETIKSASYHTRPLSSSGSSSGAGDHHGVVVNTEQGNVNDNSSDNFFSLSNYEFQLKTTSSISIY